MTLVIGFGLAARQLRLRPFSNSSECLSWDFCPVSLKITVLAFPVVFMNWSCLVLKQGSDGLIEDAWKLAREVARSTNSIDYSNALFERSGPGRSEITIFFPPSAGVLATSFGAKRCEKPPINGLSLIAGDERAWTIHFGGKPGRVPMIERLFRSSRPALLEPAEPPASFEPTHPSGAFEPTQPSPLQ